MDISADVRSLLPPPLSEKLQEVEAVLGRRVTFLRDERLRGGARGHASADGTVRLGPNYVANLSVIGEEIMHLHRWTSGYPTIEPALIARAYGYATGLTQIAGHFDEYAFFPFLEGIGLDPRAELTATLEPGIRALEAAIPEVERDGATASWRVILSVTYLQTQLIAPASPDRDRLLEIFRSPVLSQFAQLGELLCGEVREGGSENPSQVEERMTRCVYEHLQLAQTTATVRRAI